MKIILPVIIILLSGSNAASQNIFKVVEAKQCYNAALPSDNQVDKYYRIKLVDDSLSLYPLINDQCHIDTLEAIKELLALKGDKRICALPVMGYNPLKSQIYMGANKSYSIQVEALFIINQLILEHPFFYSSFPVLIDKVNSAEASVSGEIVEKAFEAYRNWYRMMKEMGIEVIKYRKIMPLDGASVRWY